MGSIIQSGLDTKSLLSQERGLKSSGYKFDMYTLFVAPLAGAWIEIGKGRTAAVQDICRSSRRSVD